MKRTAEGRQEWESGCHGKLLEEILAFGRHADAFQTSPVFLRAAAFCARERETRPRLVFAFTSVCAPAVVNEFERSNASQKD